MKYIREYQVFESEPIRTVFTKEQLNWLDKCVDGSWKYNPQTGFVDVDGDFDCGEQGLTDLKGVKFGEVSGDFHCESNQLTTLAGAPKTVDGYFRCEYNQLTSLVGAPQTVGRSFYCNDNRLTTLEGAPQVVDGYFFCNDNRLTSLEGAPPTVGRGFYCRFNQLTSLEGAPLTVGDDFSCGGNPVSSGTLKGIFGLMKNGKSYQDALEKYWPKMRDEYRVLMYKDHPSLTPEDARKYKALTTYGNIKNYL
jgi:hypothetical protein